MYNVLAVCCLVWMRVFISIPIVSPLVGNDKGRVLQSIMRCWWRTRLMGWDGLSLLAGARWWDGHKTRRSCVNVLLRNWILTLLLLQPLVFLSGFHWGMLWQIVQSYSTAAGELSWSRQQFPAKPLNVSTLWIVISFATPSVRINAME